MTKNQSRRYQAFKEGGRLIAQIRQQLAEYAQTHFDLSAIDAEAERLILEAGGQPAFPKVPGYKWTTCISVNSGFVHGIPKGTLKPGDLVTIDVGMVYKGYTTDTATSFVIGESSPEQEKFLQVGREALKKAIAAAKVGNTVADISRALQTTTEAAGYSVTRNLTGHGLGRTMHEEPAIPCFISDDPILKTPIKEGMVLAIESMYMQGGWELIQATDGWTLSTADGSLSAVFEEDIYVGYDGPEILTLAS